jgi:hypothetical protein
LIQGFYHGLTGMARSHLDATAVGAFYRCFTTDSLPRGYPG